MREKILLDTGWRFHLGDIEDVVVLDKGPVYMQAKTQEKRFGPASRGYKDIPNDFSDSGNITALSWKYVRIPHDYMIEQPPLKENNFTLGGMKYENAWYRYHFSMEEADKSKRLALYFEGVAVQSTIYLNGQLLTHNYCGYNSFEVDITDFVDFENENVLAVYVDATSKHEGWWYEGGGIYRPVWLIKTDLVSVDLYGVYVHPQKKEDLRWDVPVEVTVRNDGTKTQRITIKTVLADPEGNPAACLEQTAEIAGKQKKTVTYAASVENPPLWDVDNPKRYTAVTCILKDGEEIDQVTDRFGFRTIRFDADEGFFLNGRHVYLKGVNCHQDYGLTGKAVPERVQRYKLKLIKEMGANAFRCSHYPHSESTMEALDEMGFLVMDETRHFSSSPESLAQLEMLIKRDRNHPSVILWSIGNEEPSVMTESGLRTAETMKACVKRLDASRPVMTAVCHKPVEAPAVQAMEVLGLNYQLHNLDKLHEKYPDLPLMSSECCATGTTRGWYFPDDPVRGYLSAYDKDTTADFLGREKSWKFLMERPWVMGCFQWDSIEHRGEATWPRLCSQSGAIDLYLQKKDAFYQNQSHWLTEPMIHLMPHWNFLGLEGEPIRVVAYTNCEEAELFLNGVSLGRKTIEAYGHGEWSVAYEPGSLSVVGYRNGKAVAEDRAETSGKPAALKLKLEDEGVTADGKDVAILTCYVVDEQGRVVPDAQTEVSFAVNELGSILGSGSDVCDDVPPAAHVRRMRAGLCSLAVLAGKKSGLLKVWAFANGLKTAALEILLIEPAG
ncbi:MAG: DUF4982 domain-containing protein [Lachnospiraceae bacterium]|nr:DUF4982 domain-containing protein [Lachnospiraceae bacterium]